MHLDIDFDPDTVRAIGAAVAPTFPEVVVGRLVRVIAERAEVDWRVVVRVLSGKPVRRALAASVRAALAQYGLERLAVAPAAQVRRAS